MTREELEALIRAARLFLRPELIQECIPEAASEDDKGDGTSAASSDTKASSHASEDDEDDLISAASSDTEVSSPAPQSDETSAASSPAITTAVSYATLLENNGISLDDDNQIVYDIDEAVQSAFTIDPFKLLSPSQLEDAETILTILTIFVHAHSRKNHDKVEIESARQNDYVGIIRKILSFQPHTK